MVHLRLYCVSKWFLFENLFKSFENVKRIFLDATSGSSADWAYGAIKVPYSYTLELRPGAGTPDYSYGFTLPEDRLPLVTRETWAGVKASLVHISSKMP